MKKDLTPTPDTKPRVPTVTPSVFVNERKDGYDITFEMPGVGKDEVDLTVENRTLTVRTNTTYTPPADMECECREFPICDYAVSLDLPEQADTSTIKATVANGVLTAKVEKRAELQPRKIDVTVE